MNPKISILTPTYNRKTALAELLEALLAQTFQDFEIIVVNDAGEEIESVCALYPEMKIRVINLKENHYHVYARNRALELAEGEFIMFMDDDDLPLPTHIERMIEAMQNADLVYSDVEIVDYEEELGRRIPKNRFLFAYDSDLSAMRRFSTFVPSGSMYRKSIHKELGEFDEYVRNYWDWDFFLRVAASYRVKRVPVASVLYEFSSSGNNQSKDLNKMRIYLDRLSKKHNLGELPTKNFFVLLEEPEIKKREARTERIWDGKILQSRFFKSL